MTTDNDTIRQLNDAFRTNQTGRGRIMLTSGVAGLGDALVTDICHRVTAFDDFGPDNDPHGEHDFGSFQVQGHSVFFKIDYYNIDLTAGSENPCDPEITNRVLTIMLSEEY